MIFIDTNIPMYAAGRPHRLTIPAQQVVLAIATGEVDAVTSAEVFQEILYRYLQIEEREKGLRIFDLFARVMYGRVLPVAEEDVRLARELADSRTDLSARDLVHVAVMRNHGVRRIVTADTAFDNIDGIERLDPTRF